jgi:hypothetical protein
MNTDLLLLTHPSSLLGVPVRREGFSTRVFTKLAAVFFYCKQKCSDFDEVAILDTKLRTVFGSPRVHCEKYIRRSLHPVRNLKIVSRVFALDAKC